MSGRVRNRFLSTIRRWPTLPLIGVPAASGALSLPGLQLGWYGAEIGLALNASICTALLAFLKLSPIRQPANHGQARNSNDDQRHHHDDSLKAMHQLIGVIGHELRTPLAGMRAMTECLLQDQSDQSALCEPMDRAFLQSMRDEVVRLSNMVNNMLESARQGSGAARWNWTSFDLHAACQAALDIVRPLASTGVDLRLVSDDSSLPVNGDPDALRRLFINLLSNSIKHTSQGSIVIRINSRSSDSAGQIELVVSDTGCGISRELLSSLGSAFALNGGVINASSNAGAGLGLAICKGIVAAHGGRMMISSTPGAGTRVRVILRRDLASPCEDADCEIESDILIAEAG